jgi:hypothetical protein
MYLANEREWFSKFDPMVLMISEFSYASQVTAIPFVVGPSMVEKYASEVPEGMVFVDTLVAGPHPYRGGDLAVSVILYRLQRGSYGRELLNIVENTSAALDFAIPLGAYTKVANVVLDGVEAITRTGESTTPLMGRRNAFSPVAPGYFALIDRSHIDTDSLWVRNGQLLSGPDFDRAQPFREVDFVLYSISRVERDNVSTLSFYPLWHRVCEEAIRSSKKEIWESTKANMAALAGSIVVSPDLTEPHKFRLVDEYIETMQALHNRAISLANLGHAEASQDSDLDRIRDTAVSILKL